MPGSNFQSHQPVVRVQLSFVDHALEAAALGGVLLLGFLLYAFWPALPDIVPLLFSATGEVDGRGDKDTMLVLSAMVAFLYIALSIANFFPHRFNYPWRITEKNAARQYRIATCAMRWIKAEIVWLFTYIQWMIIQVATGAASGMGTTFYPLSLALVNVTVGLFFVKGYMAR